MKYLGQIVSNDRVQDTAIRNKYAANVMHLVSLTIRLDEQDDILLILENSIFIISIRCNNNWAIANIQRIVRIPEKEND